MLKRIKKAILRRATNYKLRRLDRFLGKSKGVIHVGANLGQERELYAKHDLHVLWIEPIQAIFDRLQVSLTNFPKQRALCRLIVDTDHSWHTFHLANNNGASSSILKMKEHLKLMPEIKCANEIQLKGITLPTLLSKENINLNNYDSLVLDTQGSELLILRGAKKILSQFKYIKIEVPDFEAYSGCVTLAVLDEELKKLNFMRSKIVKTITHHDVGSYYETLYQIAPL